MGRAVLKRAERARLVSDPGPVVGLADHPCWYGVRISIISLGRKIKQILPPELGKLGQLDVSDGSFLRNPRSGNFPGLAIQ